MMGQFHALASLENGLALLIGYMLGAIPFGLLITRFAGTADIRTIGSKNIGATNVLRTGRRDLAAATLALDALKATAAVLIGWRWGEAAAALAGLGAFLGHCFPVWLGFKGGKGVATFIGALLGLWWPGFFLFASLWIAIAYLTRYSSLAALVASALVPLVRLGLDLLYGQGLMGAALVVMAIVLWVKHAPNIARLRDGTEGRIGEKAAPTDSPAP